MSRAPAQVVLRNDDPLLAGTQTEAERRGRRRLVRELLAAGVTREELQRAVDEDRLALVPVEVVLTGRTRFSDAALLRRSGIDRAQYDAWLRASGLPAGDRITAGDIAAARALRHLLEEGIPPAMLDQIARVLGGGMATTARTMARAAGEAYLRPGDGEYELGARYAAVAADLLPHLTPLLVHQLRLHLLEALRHETIGRGERATGRISASRDLAVAFADLVGFTRLGTHVDADEVGRVASRLYDLANETLSPRVTLVKAIGDAVMLVGTDTASLVDDVLALVEAVDAEGASFPQLRAGVAYGPAVTVGGDWYGNAVNIASRVTGLARPGTVLATVDVRRLTGDRFVWSRAVPRLIRGVRGPVFVSRVRRRATGAAEPPVDVSPTGGPAPEDRS